MRTAGTRNGTGHGQLLLLAALLLGIVTMHTLGHPSGGHEGGAARPAGSGAALSAMGHDMGGASALGGGGEALGERGAAPHERGATSHGRVAAPAPAPASAPVSASASASAPTLTPAPAPDSHGGMAMDPLSVCLAVLGAFTLLVLVRAGLLRPGGTLAQLPVPGRLLHTLRPNPPPPRILLSRLSVLRI
ncbi:hypothetical protein [Streptomyces sp. KL118A]|uniref:hypothetical protein n=1 Tax=Streptomyces sp. KL118A TaxID=3045153 RepID=UPI00278C72AF|nr:hypothetical protein [Streptomyces sp. KL118A]